MKDKYSSILSNTAPDLIHAYEAVNGVSLMDANRKFKQSEKDLSRVTFVVVVVVVFMTFCSIPFSLFVRWTGLLSGILDSYPITQFMLSFLIIWIFTVVILHYCLGISSNIRKVRDESHSVLVKFEADARLVGYKDGKILNQKTILDHLINLAGKVSRTQELNALLIGKLDLVNDICSLGDHMRHVEYALDQALLAQEQFGLSHTRREIFAHIE